LYQQKHKNMQKIPEPGWKQKIVEPAQVLARIEPGMSIFLGTGVAEPRTMVKHLMSTSLANLSDLELIQIVSLGDIVSLSVSQNKQKFRLKTFFSGWLASEAITAGSVDMIPCQFSSIPKLVASGAIKVDAAFVQISPPDEAGDQGGQDDQEALGRGAAMVHVADQQRHPGGHQQPHSVGQGQGPRVPINTLPHHDGLSDSCKA
jgi:acyl-CoA hydrolase